MANNLDLLGTTRLNRILRELQDIRDIPQNLRFLNRTPVIPATDGEIMGRFKGRVISADIIFEGGRAVIHNADQFTTETNKIPKLKHGILIDEEMVSLLQRINANGGIPQDQGIIRDYTARKEDDLLLGIRQKQNALIVACMLDTFSYSRGGVVISGASWGMPSDLKFTPAILWSSTSATPITDISTARQYALETYGEVYDRITMSTSMMRSIFATTEFTAKAQLYSQIVFPANSFPLTADLGPQRRMLETILNDGSESPLTVETEDTRYWSQADNGAIYSEPYFPTDRVALSSSSDDNSSTGVWMGNAIVPESVISAMANQGAVQGQFSGPEYGPISYATVPPDLNPPDCVIWGVAKCWPIKERLTATAVINAK